MDWKKCQETQPKEGEPVIVYRPQTLYSGCYEKPLAIAIWTGKDYTCHHQPTEFLEFPLPDDWSIRHYKYQKY